MSSRYAKKSKAKSKQRTARPPEVGGTGRVLRPAFAAARGSSPRETTIAEREGAYCMFPEYPAVLAAGGADGAWPRNVPVLLRAPSIWQRDFELDPDLPWFHNSGHVVRELAPADGRGNHGVGMANLRALPTLLANPIAIWISRADGDGSRRCAMLDARDSEGVPLVAVVDVEGRDDELKIPCVHIVTIYGKEGFVHALLAAAQGGDVVYVDLERFEKALANSPLSNLALEATSRLAAFACVPATPPRDLAANLSARGVGELARMRNSFSGEPPRVDMDALLSTIPESARARAKEPVSPAPEAGETTEQQPESSPAAKRADAPAPKPTAPAKPAAAPPAEHGAPETAPAPSTADTRREEPAVPDEEDFMAEVGRAVARARGYIDDWFYLHRYDRIDGDVDEFLNRAAGGVITGMVTRGESIEDVVDAVVRGMLD